MIPTINVNLDPCADWCRVHTGYVKGAEHSLHCPAAPILIPCALPPSVTFSVVLGECTCSEHGSDHQMNPDPTCRYSRPVRVSCSISGKTWAESNVETCVFDRPLSDPDNRTAAIACSDRWDLMRALMVGESPLHDVAAHASHTLYREHRLFEQRDAVYAALADKVRAEQADDAATRRLISVCPRLTHRAVSDATASDYLSARALAAYVKHLIDQVAAL